MLSSNVKVNRTIDAVRNLCCSKRLPLAVASHLIENTPFTEAYLYVVREISTARVIWLETKELSTVTASVT